MTWEHPCILTDRVLTCVLLWVDLYMRTPRYVGIPVFIVLHRECIFSPQIVHLWQHCVKQYFGTIFPTAFVNFMSLCHILIIRTIFQTISLLMKRVILGSVISVF